MTSPFISGSCLSVQVGDYLPWVQSCCCYDIMIAAGFTRAEILQCSVCDQSTATAGLLQIGSLVSSDFSSWCSLLSGTGSAGAQVNDNGPQRRGQGGGGGTTESQVVASRERLGSRKCSTKITCLDT